LDDSIGHTHTCVEHKTALLALRKTLDPKKRKVAEGAATTVDLSNVSHSSLKRYKKHYDIDVPAGSSKQEYSAAVAQHFPTIQVNEAKDLLAFITHVENIKKRALDSSGGL
ncbi:hypothetical protein SARC_14398, partial [Sphaeroforma arctica JP610]